MDRREFLWTSGAAALSLPFLSSCAARAVAPEPLPACPAASGKRQRRRRAQHLVREYLPGAGADLAAQRHFPRHGQGRACPAEIQARHTTRPAGADRGDCADQQVHRLARSGSGDGPVTGRRASIAKSFCGTSRPATSGPERFDIGNPQSPYVISQQDGAYFSIPDFARFRAHHRNRGRRRSLSVAPVAIRHRARQRDRPNRNARLRAASSPRLGRSILRSARCASSATRLPAQSTMAESVAKRAAAKNIPGEWRARPPRSSPTKSIPRSTARSPQSRPLSRPRPPATACGAFPTATRSMPPRSPRRRPPTTRPTKSIRSASSRLPRSAPSSTPSCARAGYTRAASATG